MKIYSVGGSVRDKLLGLEPKDLDYVVVLDNIENITVEQGYQKMKQYMVDEGYTIWLETEDMFTIRAKFPKNHKFQGDADFVLARKELGYKNNSRRPKIVLGSLFDDLERRDFSINAMAEDEEGNIIDYFNGIRDLERKVLRTPINPELTFMDDPLRLLRAVRFHITKGFTFSHSILYAMKNPLILSKLEEVVSQERIREEVLKMMQHNTVNSIKVLHTLDTSYCQGILKICFGGDMWLKPTFEKKKK